MPLVSSTIPTLIGGVSQQAYNIRLPSQCERMENCMPSVVEFLRRRPATSHVSKLMNKPNIESAAVHVISRDITERYVVVVVDGRLKVFTLDGDEMPVSFPNGSAYLNTATPDMDIMCMTINDYTFFLNKTVTVRMGDALSTGRPPEALIFIKQVNYSTEYKVTLDGVTHIHKRRRMIAAIAAMVTPNHPKRRSTIATVISSKSPKQRPLMVIIHQHTNSPPQMLPQTSHRRLETRAVLMFTL